MRTIGLGVYMSKGQKLHMSFCAGNWRGPPSNPMYPLQPLESLFRLARHRVGRRSADAVLYHNDPRFVPVAWRRAGEKGRGVPVPLLHSYDLNQLAAGPGEDGGRAASLVRLTQAEVVFVGINPDAELPPLWHVMLRSLVRERPGGGRLVLLDGGPEASRFSDFLADLASSTGRDFSRADGRIMPPVLTRLR